MIWKDFLSHRETFRKMKPAIAGIINKVLCKCVACLITKNYHKKKQNRVKNFNLIMYKTVFQSLHLPLTTV